MVCLEGTNECDRESLQAKTNTNLKDPQIHHQQTNPNQIQSTTMSTSSSHHHKRRPSTSSSPNRPSKKPPPPSFPSDLDSAAPRIRLLCDLLAVTPLPHLDSALSSTVRFPLHPADVESVLKLSYSHPAPAVRFLRWAASRCSLSPYSWNLAVDLLGKNRLFDAMWDAIRSMHSQSLLSLATFASVFSSYAAAADFPAALKAFDEMQPLFGIPRNTAALNSLLSAVCREGQPVVARDFLRTRRHLVPPDADTYAILLEGWENEGDARHARDAFDEMVERVGWDPKNVPAYDSFLCTLLRGSDGTGDALRYLRILDEKRCYPGMKFFRNALEELVKVDDAKGAATLWETLVGRNRCYPDSKMYTSMIALQCYANQTEAALKYFDEMVVYGAFPDDKAYNVLLQYLLKGKRTRDAAAVFEEMVKNEFVPSEANCASAVRVFLDGRDWEMGVKVWKCMAEHGYPSEESGNEIVKNLNSLSYLDRLPEACKFAEDMIDRRVKLNSANLSRLRTSLLKIGKGSIYDHLLRKWKLH